MVKSSLIWKNAKLSRWSKLMEAPRRGGGIVLAALKIRVWGWEMKLEVIQLCKVGLLGRCRFRLIKPKFYQGKHRLFKIRHVTLSKWPFRHQVHKYPKLDWVWCRMWRILRERLEDWACWRRWDPWCKIKELRVVRATAWNKPGLINVIQHPWVLIKVLERACSLINTIKRNSI